VGKELAGRREGDEFPGQFGPLSPIGLLAMLSSRFQRLNPGLRSMLSRKTWVEARESSGPKLLRRDRLGDETLLPHLIAAVYKVHQILKRIGDTRGLFVVVIGGWRETRNDFARGPLVGAAVRRPLRYHQRARDELKGGEMLQPSRARLAPPASCKATRRT
jgi:hypothetical protein